PSTRAIPLAVLVRYLFVLVALFLVRIVEVLARVVVEIKLRLSVAPAVVILARKQRNALDQRWIVPLVFDPFHLGVALAHVTVARGPPDSLLDPEARLPNPVEVAVHLAGLVARNERRSVLGDLRDVAEPFP